ncbi:MAG: fumarylacetoacetate hydrolase family protein [Anaerolineales bacterium]|nr:fumarylacetoacetate hydrolase family protein [Anaerolineales bacterium]
MMSLLADSDTIWPIVTDVIAWVKSLPNIIEQPFVHHLSDIEIMAPVPNPSKIVCVGLNYHDHCREQGVAVPERPLLFAKFPSTLIGPEKSITLNSDVSQQVDYEAELALVIGRTARNVPLEAAYDYIAGYTIANDVSARDVQFSDGQWVRGKSFDTFCPLGPYLVTTDEIADPHNLAIRCRLNGELMQDSNTGEMIFKIPELIAFITQSSTLNPGDVIITGTPHGVGVFREPKVFLKSGDVVEVEIEGLGILRNSVI